MSGQNVIIKLGDRRHSGFCVAGCGALLMEPFNDYQCCLGCTEEVERNLAAYRVKRQKNKKVGRIVVQSHQILRQVVPMGIPVK